MTQGDLADRVGVTRQTIIAIEQGRYSPSLEMALDLVAEEPRERLAVAGGGTFEQGRWPAISAGTSPCRHGQAILWASGGRAGLDAAGAFSG
jgi:transcriptional regulator with XRE-family HTH domain